MSPRYPRVTGREVLRALQRMGIEVVRQRGSHVILRNARGKVSVLPVHAGKIIEPGLLRAILQDLDVTLEDFIAQL